MEELTESQKLSLLLVDLLKILQALLSLVMGREPNFSKIWMKVQSSIREMALENF